MKKFTFLLVLLFSTFLFSQRREQTDEEKLLSAMHKIESQTLFKYVDTLCMDHFRGRLTGDVGYDLAAEWLIKKMKNFGLKPLDAEKSYLQKFPHPYTLVKKDCKVAMQIKQGSQTITKNYNYFNEYVPGSTSSTGDVTAEVVYVGYGTTAPEIGYDDYAGIDVKGKIVCVEPESPIGPSAKNAEAFKKWRDYSFHQYKLENAVKHGAIGMLYNYGPIANPNNAYSKDFVYAHVGAVVMADLFAGSGKTHSDTKKKINTELKPQSFNTGKIFNIKMTTEHHPEGIGSNVIGYIEGSDPSLKDEFIIIGGHLDFLGYCYDLMTGANDNASAVAVMLGVAEAFNNCKIKPKRSIMFLSFGAEEAAIKGAQAYLKSPLVPFNKTIGLVNMDGVGIGTAISGGFGDNYPAFFNYFKKANDKYIHRSLGSDYSDNLGRPRLDAAYFDWAKIPTLNFATYGGGPNFPTYHLPLDKIDFITPEIMEDLSQLLFIGIMDIANDVNNLKFERK